MKRSFFFLSLLIVIGLIVGCSSNQTKTTSTQIEKDPNESNNFVQKEIPQKQTFLKKITKPTAAQINEDINKNNNTNQRKSLSNPYIKISYFEANDPIKSNEPAAPGRLITTGEYNDGIFGFYYLAQYENDPTPTYCEQIFIGDEYQGIAKYAQDIVHSDKYEIVGQSGGQIYYEKFYVSRKHPEKGYDLYTARIGGDNEDTMGDGLTDKKKLLSVKYPSTSPYATDPSAKFFALNVSTGEVGAAIIRNKIHDRSRNVNVVTYYIYLPKENKLITINNDYKFLNNTFYYVNDYNVSDNSSYTFFYDLTKKNLVFPYFVSDTGFTFIKMNTTNGEPLLNKNGTVKLVDSQYEKMQFIDVFQNSKGHLFYVTKAFPLDDQSIPKLTIIVSDDQLNPLPNSKESFDLPNNEPLSADFINNVIHIWTTHISNSDNNLWEEILHTS